MSRKILYFINPVSGTQDKQALMKKIAEATNQHQVPFEILFTNPEGNYLYLEEKIRFESFTDVVICGGDGSINQITGSLLEQPVNIGIVPMGSGNGLALAAGIPANTDKALNNLFTGQPAEVDAFYINSVFSCMLCGLGFDAQVAHAFARQSRRGLRTYVQQALLNFMKMKPWFFEIINGGKCIGTEAYFISIANSNQFGNQFTIAPKASLSDGLLDIIVVKKMSKPRFIWSVFKQVVKGKLSTYNDPANRKKNLLYFQTNQLIIRNPQMAPLHVDGDPAVTANNFVIKVIPRAFKLIQPSLKIK